MALAEQFQRGIETIPGIHLYGGEKRVAAIVSCNLADLDSAYVSDCLARRLWDCDKGGGTLRTFDAHPFWHRKTGHGTI